MTSSSADDSPSSGLVQTSVGIDYLAKDYPSFRRLMLDRLNARAPDAATGQPADPGTLLVELLAHAADLLSYQQDAVATEAYLGTARLRTSVRRHARLLDYQMHDGCNARAFVAIVVQSSADKLVLPAGTQILTSTAGQPAILTAADIDAAQAEGAQVFETLHDLALHQAHNQMALAGGKELTLPAGATSAVLANDDLTLSLSTGDVVIFEDCASDGGPTADPTLRHAVRLTSVQRLVDGAGTQHALSIAWSSADALPFALPGARTRVIGNIVLADHGRTLTDSEGVALPERRLRRPALQQGAVTWQSQVLVDGRPQSFDVGAAASAAIPASIAAGGLLRPVITLTDADGRTWTARRDLLGSGPHDTDFVVEVDDSGTACLRFGDDVYGRYPSGELLAHYRVGNGTIGNVGAESLYHIVSTLPGLLYARNPLPASGGTDPEPIDKVQLYAPRYFHKQDRAVTADDYVAVLRSLPEVRAARVTRRYTGSGYTLMITVQRASGLPVDAEFSARLRQLLEGYRMLGHDLQISGPVQVPLDIELAVQVASGHWRSVVLAALKAALGSGTDSGKPGFFHPDRCVLGQPLYLSQLVTAALAIPGVVDVAATRFQRWNGSSALSSEVIPMSAYELPVVDNLAGKPERGQLSILLGGGM